MALNSRILDQNNGDLMMLKNSFDIPKLGASSHMKNSPTTTFGRQVKEHKILSSSGSIIAEMPKRSLYASPFDHVAFGLGRIENLVDRKVEDKAYSGHH